MIEQRSAPELFPPLLDDQQFTAADVLAVSGLSAGQLKGILDRNQISLSTNHNPGTGRRRMFNGKDILALSAVNAASRIGFPLRWGNALAQHVVGYATRMHIDTALGIKSPDFALAFYPADDGEDWAFVPLHEGQPEPSLPTAFQVLAVSQEITQTLAKLAAIVKEEPIPDFNPPQPAPYENPYGPKINFFRIWTKDQSGGWLLTGLTQEETLEYMNLKGWVLDGDEVTCSDAPRLFGEDLARSVELANKHEVARLRKIGGETV